MVKRQEVILATCNTNDGSASVTVRFRIQIPSSRVRVKFGIAWFSPSVQTEPTFTDCTLTSLRPYIVDANGTEAPADAVTFTGGASTDTLPYAAEASTGADGVRGVATLTGHTSQAGGAWKAVATWEPAPGVCREDWEALASGCQLALESKNGQQLFCGIA